MGFLLGYFSHFALVTGKKGETKAPRVSESGSTSSQGDLERPEKVVAEKRRGGIGTREGLIERNEPRSDPRMLSVGVVVIENRWGYEISRISVPVLSGAWVALPTRAFLGGVRMAFMLPDQPWGFRIEKGTWRDGDLISLWYVEAWDRNETSPLRPWKDGRSLEWVPLDAPDASVSVNLSPHERKGLFAVCAIPEAIREPGVFFQENNVVGWTFGPWVEGGYLWLGPEGKGILDRMTIEMIYDITFANGREEQFSRALAMGEDTTVSERLDAFAEGFRLSPRLSKEECPAPFRTESVLGPMKSLVGRLMQIGSHQEVLGALDLQVLREASDPSLLRAAMEALSELYDYESAVDLAEALRAGLRRDQREEISDLDRFHVSLYADWIKESIERGDIAGGFRSYARARGIFPENPHIQLLGVELALEDGDWGEAQRLLRSGNYPKSLADRVRVLNMRASDLQEERTKILVRFTPGAQQIPVKALLNGRLTQEFIIDTGASTLTIPFSAVEALGIKLELTPRRVVSTAGGRRSTREVQLSSIALGDWTVRDVAALVVDIPDKPGLGLLGLNFLNRFHVEINHDRGVLSLTPR